MAIAAVHVSIAPAPSLNLGLRLLIRLLIRWLVAVLLTVFDDSRHLVLLIIVFVLSISLWDCALQLQPLNLVSRAPIESHATAAAAAAVAIAAANTAAAVAAVAAAACIPIPWQEHEVLLTDDKVVARARVCRVLSTVPPCCHDSAVRVPPLGLSLVRPDPARAKRPVPVMPTALATTITTTTTTTITTASATSAASAARLARLAHVCAGVCTALLNLPGSVGLGCPRSLSLVMLAMVVVVAVAVPVVVAVVAVSVPVRVGILEAVQSDLRVLVL